MAAQVVSLILSSLIATHLHGLADAQPRKILALHGGGESADSMQSGTRDLRSALGSGYEWVFASIGSRSTGEVWWADPPSKGVPTTSRDHASGMAAALDAIVASQGPFYAIMGYSQGAAAVPVYLAHAPDGTFAKAVMFCGYLPTTHTGLVSNINERSPFGGIPGLVWMGALDPIISNPMSLGQAGVFVNPTTVTSESGGHAVPLRSDPTFDTVAAWIREDAPTAAAPTAAPTEALSGNEVTTAAPTTSPSTSRAAPGGVALSAALVGAMALVHFISMGLL